MTEGQRDALKLHRVHAEHVSGDKSVSGWMSMEDAEDHADDLDGQGVYRNIRLEIDRD